MIYEFGHFHLDTDQFLLTANNNKIEVEPQVFDLLVFLIENRDKLVTRDEIFENLWHGKEVLDATLSNHIKIARAILEDDGQAQRVIKTIRGRGYQFVATVEERPTDNALNNTHRKQDHSFFSSNKKTLAISVLFFAILLIVFKFFFPVNQDRVENVLSTGLNDSLQSIAVLPFENRSNIASDLFFTDGIHDDLLTRISKIIQLKTISRTSVMAYRHTKKNIKLIAQELGVTSILEGGVQRAGNEIRINVQLINAKTDEHIWAESYTRELTAENVFAIQSEISNEIAKQLKIQLLVTKKHAPTQSMEALEAFFHAQFSSDLLTREGKLTAKTHLENAIKLDPKFAMPYAFLALIELERVFWDGKVASEQAPKAQLLIDKALAIDENSSEAYSALALLKILKEDFIAAEKFYNKATSLEPNNIFALTAHADFHLLEVKDFSKAVSLLRRATNLSPKDDALAYVLAKAYISAGEYEQSKAILNRILKSNPSFAQAFRALSDIAFFSHYDYADSIELLYQYMKLDPGVSGTPKLIAQTYLHTGDTQQVINWFKYSLTLTNNSKRSKQTQAYLYTTQGKFNQAFNLYLNLSENSATFRRALFTLAKLGKKTNRMSEVLNKFEEVLPSMFEKNISINRSNYVSAFTLGKLLKDKNQIQSEFLLQESLKVAQEEERKGWFGKHYAWKAKILTAMGNYSAAIQNLQSLEKYGYASELLINDDDFYELRDIPAFILIVNKMNTRLDLEREKLRQLELDGMLKIPEN